MLVVHPQDRKRPVVDRIGRRRIEDGTEQSAERVLEEGPKLGMKDGVDVVGSSLPPRSFEAVETERPIPLVHPAGVDVELSHDLGGSVGALFGMSREAMTFCWIRHNAHRLPSRAARKRSSGDRCPGGDSAMGS